MDPGFQWIPENCLITDSNPLIYYECFSRRELHNLIVRESGQYTLPNE